MKKYYSILDIAVEALITRAMQHVLNHDMARQLKGKITYYTAEDPDTVIFQKATRSMLINPVDADGFIFLHLRQFCYGETFNMDLLRTFLEKGHEVHFTREKISLFNIKDLNKEFDTLFVYDQMYGSNADNGSIKELLKMHEEECGK